MTAYRAWRGGAHRPAHARRTAEKNAAFLLPLLKPGMRLLDAGCGPGSITIGLAAAVAPGEAVGVDADETSLEVARAMAAERGCANVRFETGDVYALPFEDETFDAAFAHALLQHLADPLAAVREMHRVLKPGGIIALADADYDGSLFWPTTPELERASALDRRLRELNGGQWDVGRRLRGLLHEAGFVRTEGSAVAGCEGTEVSTRMTGEFTARLYDAPEYIAHVVGNGLATEAEMAEFAAAWRAWGAHPGAYWARFWCQCVGWK